MEESSSSSSDSSDSEDGTVTMDDGAADRLEAKLLANPFSFELHVEYVHTLRKLGALSKLREAREKLSSLFPLPVGEWQSWLEDEVRLASTKEEKEHVSGLFRRAVGDYESTELWVEFTKWLEQSQSDLKPVRSLFEEALGHVGLDVQRGAEVWEAFIAFEGRVLESLQKSKAKAPEIKKQKEAVRGIYRRALSLPLKDLSLLMDLYCKWEEQVGGEKEAIAAVKKLHEQATAKYEELRPFEEAIGAEQTVPDYSKLDKWHEYIEYQVQQKDPSRTTMLFERAVRQYCLVHDLWSQYIGFLETNLKDVHSVILGVHKRAVRNCGWSAQLWVSYMRALERANRPAKEVQDVFESSLGAGMQSAEEYALTFNAFIDYQRRRLIPSKSDVTPEKGEEIRGVFQRACDYLSQYFSSSPSLQELLAYWAGFECEVLGDVPRARSLWEKVIHADGRSAVNWLGFIQMEKSFGDQQACRSLFKRACHSIKDYPESLCQEWLVFERKHGTLEQWELATQRTQAAIQEVSAARERDAQSLIQQAKSSDKRKKRVAEDAGDERKKEKKQKVGHGSARTAFVVNLPFAVNEETLREKFSQFGAVEDVRLVKYKDGKSKGYAYVDFEDEKCAAASLSLDKTEWLGRTIKVSISSPPPRDRVRDQPSTNTAFLSNLSPGITREVLQETFGSCGEIKDIRIVKERSGKLKGIAYIDFADAQGLKTALTLDQTLVKGNKLNVKASRPPKQDTQATREAAEDPPAPKVHQTPRSRAPLVPRSMRVAQTKDKDAKEEAPKEPAKPVGSNADFRKKFLGK